MSPTLAVIIAVTSVVISAASFVINGVVGKRLRQGAVLLTVQDLSPHFVLKADYSADRREERERRAWLEERVLQPMNDLVKSVHALSIASSVQAEALKYNSTEVGEMKDELRALRDELLRSRRGQAN